MPDRLVRGIVPGGLRAVFVRVTDTARIARMLHGLYPTAAHLFAQSMAAGLLVASLQKGRSRVNVQLECDGPIGGTFVDADGDGNVRGYVRRPQVHFPGDPEVGARAALGGSGFVSVLRDLGGANFYRGQVELRSLDVARDLERYFVDSEQVATALDLAVVAREGEPLGDAAGLLFQRLPDGEETALETVRTRLRAGAFRDALRRGAGPQDAIAAVAAGPFELLADLEVASRCGCSLERARAAVTVLGREGLEDVLATDREAVITCEFCRERYVIGEPELRDLARRLAERDNA